MTGTTVMTRADWSRCNLRYFLLLNTLTCDYVQNHYLFNLFNLLRDRFECSQNINRQFKMKLWKVNETA